MTKHLKKPEPFPAPGHKHSLSPVSARALGPGLIQGKVSTAFKTCAEGLLL